MAILIITLLIILYGYFSLAEIALISVTESELTDEKNAVNPKTAIVSGLIRKPEEFLSAVQVGMTLVGMLEGIYGGNLLAGILKAKLIEYGISEVTASISSIIIGIGLITYITIVFGELVPKSIALQMPMKVSLAIAPSLRLFSKLTYPIIQLLTVSTRYILSFLRIKKSDKRKVSETDLRKMLSVAYQQGVFSKQQLWLHQNVLTFKDLTAKRIMKPARIVVSLPDHWKRDQVKQFISKRQYSYFPVFKNVESNVIGIIRTKSFLLDDDIHWQKNIINPCNLLDNTPAKDIFTLFKEKKLDFGLVYDNSNHYVGIVAMQDIMEGVFGDLPEIEDYSSYFYKESDKKWIAEGFIHLQRIRIDLNLPWLREYESKYLSLSELIAGEIDSTEGQRSITLNDVTFRVISSSQDASEKIAILLP
jgi:putative hemolysin